MIFLYLTRLKNIFLESLVTTQMYLKTNKDFMKSFKKSDQLEGEEKIFLKLKKQKMKRCTVIHLLSKNYIIDFEISFHFLKIFFTKYFKKIKNKFYISKEIQKAKVVFYYQIQFLHHHLQHNHFYFLLVEMHLLMHLLFQIHNYHL